MPATFINGIDLYYQIEGSGEPLILVHALGMDSSMWDPQVREFSSRCQVIRYDLRGHGRSSAPDQPYSLDLFADDLDYFLHYLGLKKAALLGISLGGRILLRFALKYGTEVGALLLADAQSETPPESKDRFRDLAETARREGMAKAAETFFSFPLLKSLERRQPQRFQREKTRCARSSAAGFAQSCLAIADMQPLTGQLGAIQARTLALAGEEDEPYVPFLDLYQRGIPRCRKEVIPQAGHLSNLENPPAFNEVVLRFLQEGQP